LTALVENLVTLPMTGPRYCPVLSAVAQEGIAMMDLITRELIVWGKVKPSSMVAA